MENLENKSRIVRIELDGISETFLRIEGTMSPEEARETACSSKIIQSYVGQYGKDRVKVIIYK